MSAERGGWGSRVKDEVANEWVSTCRVHELTVMKQNDRQILNSLEQRLGYEQRQRKQLETMLGNERKLRIKCEEKAAKW